MHATSIKCEYYRDKKNVMHHQREGTTEIQLETANDYIVICIKNIDI